MSWFSILMVAVGLYVGYNIGWQKAHKTIATECQRLGSFYVGSRTFKCIEIEEKQQ
ncbi:hypothetical protein BNCALIDO_00152 [Aeromonas phage vB_AdhM_TS9]|nr:hypothetical protein BNCALIDO_00152 [Aeromonas phage vB_AdhM_TS9]